MLRAPCFLSYLKGWTVQVWENGIQIISSLCCRKNLEYGRHQGDRREGEGGGAGEKGGGAGHGGEKAEGEAGRGREKGAQDVSPTQRERFKGENPSSSMTESHWGGAGHLTDILQGVC